MSIVHLFHQGGLVMYPLAIVSIVAIAILIERTLMYNKARTNMDVMLKAVAEYVGKKDWQGLEAACDKDGGAAASVVSSAIKRSHNPKLQEQLIETAAMAEAARLRRFINYLETIVTLAPLLGLLGTVTGMIGSFSILSVSEGQPFAITGGVGEALIATATGLCVAIIALLIHTYLRQRQDGLLAQIEELSAVYVAAVAGDNDEA